MTVADGRVAFRQRSFAWGWPLERDSMPPDHLIVVDVQEGFRKAIPDFERIAKATAT